ncbi:MAG TPA: helix-turn-helix domain-containing protein [Actinomycetota bacterium]|nr:helix-turn-helix domain-containing protein [Actinomycetota bacterium]
MSHDHPADRILDAALHVFARRGLRAGTLGEIADRAGVGRATIYRYYPGRDAVVQALVLREAGALMARLDEVLGACEDDPERMVELGLVAALDHLSSHALLQRTLRDEPETILPALTLDAQPLVEAGIAFATPYIERAVKAERMAKVDPRAAAEWAVRILLSLLLTPPVGVDLSDRRQVRRFLSVVMPTIGGGR